MSTYVYKARDMRGNVANGEVEGESKAAIAADLRRKGFIVLDVDEKHVGVTLDELFRRFERVKLKDLVIFTRQFATLINAGMALLRSIYILEQQTESKKLKRVLNAVRMDVEAGQALSNAMERHPDVFNRLYISMVRAGEVGGVLDGTLNNIANQLEAEDELRRNVKSAMVYPSFIGVFAIVILLGMVMFLIPIFVGIFASLGSELPALTQLMVDLSNLLRKFWYIIFPLIGLMIYGLIRLKRTDQGREVWDRFKLRIPMKIGPIVQKIALARFSRTLGTLISSGVPILQAIQITGESSGNVVIEKGMNDVYESVKQGTPIATPLEKISVFPPMVVQMISVGEETGALDAMLNKIAEFYDSEVRAAIKALTSIIEPIMMIGIGALVALIVVSMYLPMFKLWSAIK